MISRAYFFGLIKPLGFAFDYRDEAAQANGGYARASRVFARRLRDERALL